MSIDVEMVPLKKVKIEGRSRQELGNIEELAATMKDKGLLQPIVLNQFYKLLAGERRFRAAEFLEWTEIPAVVHHTSGTLDALEIELIENSARKDFTWQERAKLERSIYERKLQADPKWRQGDQAALTEQSVGAVNRRIQLAEAIETLPELAECTTEDEAWKVLKKLEEDYVVQELIEKAPPEVKQASKWANDHYTVGDSLTEMKKVNGDIADFAEVDPPFGVEIIEDRKARNKSKEGHENYNEWPAETYSAQYTEMAAEVFRILKRNAFAVFWFGPTWHSETLAALRSVGFSVPDIPAVWTKGAVGQTASPDTTFGSCYEPFWLARKGNPKLAKPGRGNVFSFTPVSPMKKIHATEKPIELLKDIISSICFPGSAILVPFLGSGVTLRAAYALGHTGWGYDLSEENKKLFLRKVHEDGGNGNDN